MNLREFFTSHTWWGKFFGAVFGYLIFGSVGACFGIIIGNLFDRGFISHYTNPNWFYLKEKRKAIQKIFFETTFLLMGHIAKADGRVSEREINMAKTIMSEMRLNREQRNQAKRLYTEGKEANFNLDVLINYLETTLKGNRDLLRLFIDIQYRAAQVDGLTTKKIQILDTILTRLGFAPLHQQYRFQEDFDYATDDQQRYQQSQQQNSSSYRGSSSQPPRNNLDHAYALLQVSPKATKPEVKRAYRVLLNRNHPDKLISKGLPAEMMKMATDKTQKIVKAYELICKSKGW